MSYAAHHSLSDPARPRAELWRTLLGTLAIAVISLALTIAWYLGQGVLAQTAGPEVFNPSKTPSGMVWTLSTFLCPLIAVAMVLRLLHRRGIASLIGPRGVAGTQFIKVFAVQAAVVVLAMLLPAPGGAEPVRNLAFGVWLSWLPLALVMLAVQIGSEELIFRGYMQSQLAARLRSPLLWIGIPAALFAVLHLDPSAGGNMWLVVGVTFLFAIAAGDLTARTGTLGPALAMHFVNNVSSLLLVGASGQLRGMALYVFPFDMSDPALAPSFALEALLILIAWLGARIVLRR